MMQPHFVVFAAMEMYGETSVSVMAEEGAFFFFNPDDDRKIPVPQDVLVRAAEMERSSTVPASVSDRQFFQALAKRGYITKEEKIAAIKVGDIPGPFQMVINALPLGALPPDMDIDDVEDMVSGATSFERNHPVSQIIAATFGWSAEEADEFWRYAASL